MNIHLVEIKFLMHFNRLDVCWYDGNAIYGIKI